VSIHADILFSCFLIIFFSYFIAKLNDELEKNTYFSIPEWIRAIVGLFALVSFFVIFGTLAHWIWS
jgi:hypothetical protein